jgi:hypothetical protein
MADSEFTPEDQKIAAAREYIAGALALLASERCGTAWDPSDEIDRKNCAVSLLLQAHGALMVMEGA